MFICEEDCAFIAQIDSSCSLHRCNGCKESLAQQLVFLSEISVKLIESINVTVKSENRYMVMTNSSTLINIFNDDSDVTGNIYYKCTIKNNG